MQSVYQYFHEHNKGTENRTVWYLSNFSTATISISERAIIWLEVNCVPIMDVHVRNTNAW